MSFLCLLVILGGANHNENKDKNNGSKTKNKRAGHYTFKH